MLSAIFVDRPRFAIVIALVISIAGLVSLLVIPLAQYPDIVPPQVQVTTTYPGANSAVVDATVAQPIEAQVVVPQAALLTDQQGVYVFIVEDGKVAIRRIKTGGASGADIIVTEGLSGNELVVVQGLETLRPGTAVRATPVPAALSRS